MTGAEIIINCLLEQGVDTVFGYPGGTILNVYDALYKSGKIHHYLTAHEQGAAHAADGYARATGKVGVCFATSGPGCTNLVTGIATAYMDSTPMVAITCNVASGLLGRDSFQEVDITGITMPITKHNYIVPSVDKLADIIREAFYIANSGRRGPVLIDIPKDVTAAQCDYAPAKPKAIVPTADVTDADVAKAVKMINASARPFIVSGGGVIASGAEEEIKKLAALIDSPVACTFMGIGSYDTTAPEYTGMIGMHGTKASNIGVNTCDLLIAVGMRFSDRVISDSSKFATGAKILHIDIDAAEIGKNIRIDHALTGDAKLILNKILPAVKQKHADEWLKQIESHKREFPKMDLSADAPINPEYILEKISDVTKGDAIMVTEVGQHQMWTGQFCRFKKPRTLLSSGGLGTMGFGTGAAMGAQVGCPDKRVISIAGDGCFRMNCNELSTVQYYNIPIIIVIMNNGTLGMVRQWQTLFYGGRYSETTLDRGPDFKKLAEAYFIDGYTVYTKEDFDAALASALAKNAPAVIDAHIDTDEFVLPMVSPGHPIEDLITTNEKKRPL